MVLYVVIFISIIISALFAIICFKLHSKYKKLENDALKISIAVKRLRYGDVHVRVDNLYNKKFEIETNRLFETIADREMMIKEYQSTLSNKNLSLEEILKHEKQMHLFKEDFAATLTHDMKVPVIAELNSLNYLLDGRFGDLNDKQKEILKLMKSSNQELKELIENMLETYRLEQKSISLNLQKQNLNIFLQNIINEMQPIVISTSHTLSEDIEQTKDFEFEFDEFQLRRVIKNLLQNAISFSPNNSTINLSTELFDNKVKINIENNGSSISQEDLELIFQKYYCGHSKFRKAGTGLGLYLSQQIVIAHNGNITVDNSKEGLTTFTLTLSI